MTKSTETSALPPRPLNCFLLYRIDKQKEIVAKCEGANHRDISKIIAKWWKEATDEEKTPYVKMAQEEKRKHAKLYPDYKYSPKKKTTPKRIYRRKTNSSFTSRKEENNKIMELIYEDPATLQTVETSTVNKDCSREAIINKSTNREIKIEQVEYPATPCDTFADAPSLFTDDGTSLSSKSPSSAFSISPVLSWESSPRSCRYAMVSDDVESPHLSFSTRLPLQTFSPVNCDLFSPVTESTTECSTPSAVFSPTSYHIEPSAMCFDSQGQIYDSLSCDMSLNGMPTPTDMTPNVSYFVELNSTTDFEDINMQYSNDCIFISECHEHVPSGLPANLHYPSLYSNLYSSLESSYLPQCIDPTFIMKY